MLSLPNIKTILIILMLLGILSTIIILATQTSTPSTQTPLPISTIQPTSYPNLAPPSISPQASVNNVFNQYSEEYLQKQAEILKQEQPAIDQALLVSKFVDKLPFNGQFISVTYNIYTNQITLEYERSNKADALQEFANLLKENQIQNINWLYNLGILEK